VSCIREHDMCLVAFPGGDRECEVRPAIQNQRHRTKRREFTFTIGFPSSVWHIPNGI